jgi:hypothetical protein
MYGKIEKIHFVGIGGIGMSGIAEVQSAAAGVSRKTLRSAPPASRNRIDRVSPARQSES